MPDDVWLPALAKAKRRGVTLQGVIQDALEQFIGEDGEDDHGVRRAGPDRTP